MSNQVTKIFSDMSDEELALVIQEMKEDGPQGIVRMEGIVREKCKMVQEITSGNAYEHMMTVQFSILQEAAYRFTPKKMDIPIVRYSIFLIEKGWVDSMENHNADGYELFGYKLTEQEAKEFCESKGYWTDKDCWSIAYHPNKQMAKYRYREIQYCGI